MTSPEAGGFAARAIRYVALRIRTASLPSLSVERRAAPERRDIRLYLLFACLTIIALGLGKVYLPVGLPGSVVLLGAIIGGLNGLTATAIVLIFRANRIVNFAQGELGAFAATLAYMLIVTLKWPWIAAVTVALLAAAAAGALVEFGIVRRFFHSPRLILTVATVGVAQFLTGFRLGLPIFFPRIPAQSGGFPTPFSSAAFRLGQSIFSYDDLIIFITVPLATAAVALFLGRTWAGLGTRAAAENLDRSRLLGIHVRRLSTMVWAVAALLSGLTAILRAPVTGFSLLSTSGSVNLVRALAPAAIGGFKNLPLTFFAAIVLGITEQAFFFNFARGGPLVTVLLVVMLAALVIRGRSHSSFQAADASSWTNVADVRRIPRSVLRLPEVRVLRAFSLTVLVVLLALAPQILSPGQTALAGLVGINIIVGLSIIILTGWAGQVSLGQWALVGVGAFAAGNFAARSGLDFFLILTLTSLIGGLLALVLGIPAQRMPGILFGATTLAFGVAAANWIFNLEFLQGGTKIARPVLFGRISLVSTNAFYYFVLVATMVTVIGVWNLKRFRFADRLISVRDNPKAAEAFGISVSSTRRWAFFLSGALASFAGALYGFHQGFIATNRFPAEAGVTLLSMVVIGGLGSISGVAIGALVIRGTQYFLPAWAGFFVTGFGLLIVLLVFPGGIGEVIFRLRYRVVSLIARRRGISLSPGAGIAAPLLPGRPRLAPEPGESVPGSSS